MHTWKKTDDIVALYLWKFGADSLNVPLPQIAALLGMSEASLRMRMRNFQSIHSGGALTNWAVQSENIYDRFYNISEPELTKLANEAIHPK